MNYNYILINEEFVGKLSPIAKEGLDKHIYPAYLSYLKNKSKALSLEEYYKKVNYCKVKFKVNYCTYCKALSILGFPNANMKTLGEAKYCVQCGATNIYKMAENGLYRVQVVMTIAEKLVNDEEKEILNQQILVMIATKLECYLREFYKTYLNMTIVKRGINQISKFEKECKNDFININKTYDRFRKELGIDLREIIDKEDKTILNELFTYRNVIVHNNAIVDDKFTKSINSTLSLGQEVKVTTAMINNYLKTTKKMINLTGTKYEEIYEKECIDELDFLFRNQKLNGIIDAESE